jgi:hydroxyacylglutathione hydrolase
MGIFTGDFLFVGDVGRPDLLEKTVGVAGTSRTGAKQMFESLRKIEKMPDFLQVWPAHGAGSSCGKSLGAVPMSTLGYEMLFNWSFQIKNEEKFIEELLNGQPDPPKYFAQMKKLNKVGPELLHLEETPIKQFPLAEDAILIDTRSSNEFANGHVVGALNLPYNKSFTNWAGWLIGYDRDIVLITSKDKLMDVKKSLQSIGLDRVTGYIQPESLGSDIVSYKNVTPAQVKDLIVDKDYYVIDVRNRNEWESGHIPGANHLMLGNLKEKLVSIPKNKKIIVQCQSGARSAIGVSVLQANGFKNVLNMKGGFSAWKDKGFPIEIDG